jgi:hypothetical protein
MTIYYSKSAQGFFDTALFSIEAMPSDVVPITVQQHYDLMMGQTNGMRIDGDENGMPILREHDPATEEDVRAIRDLALKETDWTQLPDIPQTTKDKWAAYRQALRDVTTQAGFPVAVVWPVKPE